MKQPRTDLSQETQAGTPAPAAPVHPLNTVLFDGRERKPIQPHAPPEGAFSHWLSLDQIRRMQRMRRETVLAAMESGELPYERRGRIRYARLSDVLVWEERRLTQPVPPSRRTIHPSLAHLLP